MSFLFPSNWKKRKEKKKKHYKEKGCASFLLLWSLYHYLPLGPLTSFGSFLPFSDLPLACLLPLTLWALPSCCATEYLEYSIESCPFYFPDSSVSYSEILHSLMFCFLLRSSSGLSTLASSSPSSASCPWLSFHNSAANSHIASSEPNHTLLQTHLGSPSN